MSILDLEAIKQGLEAKTDQQLIDILSFTQDDYKPEVIPIIENILLSRGLSIQDIETYKASYLKLKSKIDNQKHEYKYKTPLIVTIITVAIGSFVWRTITTNYFNKQSSALQEQIWTTGYTDSIKSILINSTGFKSIPDKYKNDFCGCYLGELKKNYPHRLKTTKPSNKHDSLINICADQVLKKTN
jgi:hypothetical protein